MQYKIEIEEYNLSRIIDIVGINQIISNYECWKNTVPCFFQDYIEDFINYNWSNQEDVYELILSELSFSVDQMYRLYQNNQNTVNLLGIIGVNDSADVWLTVAAHERKLDICRLVLIDNRVIPLGEGVTFWVDYEYHLSKVGIILDDLCSYSLNSFPLKWRRIVQMVINDGVETAIHDDAGNVMCAIWNNHTEQEELLAVINSIRASLLHCVRASLDKRIGDKICNIYSPYYMNVNRDVVLNSYEIDSTNGLMLVNLVSEERSYTVPVADYSAVNNKPYTFKRK